MDSNCKKKKQKNKSISIVTILLLLVFCGIFSVSAFKIGSTLLENKKSAKAYESLRDQASQLTQSGSSQSGNGQNENGQSGNGQNGNDQNRNGQNGNEGDSDGENISKEKENGKKPSVNIHSLQKKYPELQGWIRLADSDLDYPIMQADNNEFYLDHLYDGSQNPNGSLFMDFRNSGILTDDNTVIYGHNMDNGAMFAVLNKYKSQEFYEKHKTLTITTEDADYQMEVISGTVEDGDYQFVEFDFDTFAEMEAYVSELCSRSTFESKVKLKKGDKLISLCTCTYENQNARYMLVGVVR